MANPVELENRFMWHPPKDAARADAHESVRELCRTMAAAMNDLLPEGREKSVVFTKLEEVMFWGNAAVAREN